MRLSRNLLSFILVSFAMIRAFTQAKNDYHWIQGYPPNIPGQYFGGIELNFDSNEVNVNYFDTKFVSAQASILSSNSGQLLVYSNGCSIFNAIGDTMQNGDTIAYGYIWESYCSDSGYPGTQNHILIPWPGDTTKAILLYLKSKEDISTYYLLDAIIQFNADHPLGYVLEKDHYLLTPGTTALLTCTKHANGRDWWIVLPENNTNRFFTFLLDPERVNLVKTQSVGHPWGEREWASQAIFTPDGNKYIRFNPWKGLDIFSFDRCTGTLTSLLESGPLTDPVEVGGGVASSVDSRFIYVANYTHLYQFDLSAPDILGSKILIGTYDGYLNPFATTFFQLTLAPDGKIYGTSTNGVKSMHVIHDPGKEGVACNFQQHGLDLPAYNFIGSVNIPYFRLGPWDGSPCDTLGINNIPVADFRYAYDSLNPLNINFRNLSYFDPRYFHWTFGDNTSSELEAPEQHLYGENGTYEVCLTASNEYGQNTFCRLIPIPDSTTGIITVETASDIMVVPNPFHDELTIEMPGEPRDVTFKLISDIGVVVLTRSLNFVNTPIWISDLPPGMYNYSIEQDGRMLKTGKLVKM